jgi:alkaline phosphatase D
MRIIHISDTHLTPRLTHFAQNTAAVADWLAIQQADLVIHTGDVAMDGAADRADLAFGAAWNDRLGIPVHCVPGNHDIGDTVTLRPDQEVSDERLEAWHATLGPDRWSLDREGWRLIGLNAMLMGTGHPEESRQLDWFADALEHVGPIALFLHKPLFVVSPDEGPRGYWTVPPEPRRPLLDLMARRDVRLIGSGHLHIHRQAEFSGVRHVWAPSSAFVVGPLQEPLGGHRVLGVLTYDLNRDGVEIRYHRPSGLVDRDIDPVIQEIYPRPAGKSAA